jgi:hypothetical protein
VKMETVGDLLEVLAHFPKEMPIRVIEDNDNNAWLRGFFDNGLFESDHTQSKPFVYVKENSTVVTEDFEPKPDKEHPIAVLVL